MQHDWVLKRNCSLSPRQLALAYAVLCAGSLGVAAAFALRGIWFVLAFTLVELAAVAVALLCYARHALDREHIALSDACLLVERVSAGRCEQLRLDPTWTYVALPDRRPRTLIAIESRGVRVEVGAYVSAAVREQVARELRGALRNRSLLV